MIDTVLCFAATLLLQVITPWWWWVILVPFGFGILKAKSGGYALLLGVISAGTLWFAASMYHYFTGSQIIACRIAEMLALNSVYALILLVTVVAALCGGIGAITGYFLRRLFST
jgi:hypothetical protein